MFQDVQFFGLSNHTLRETNDITPKYWTKKGLVRMGDGTKLKHDV